jgi:hypothetical protein
VIVLCHTVVALVLLLLLAMTYHLDKKLLKDLVIGFALVIGAIVFYMSLAQVDLYWSK